MFELIYTAAPEGLIQGRSGFTTVAMSTGFPANLIQTVENMSSYRKPDPPADGRKLPPPVNCCYQLVNFGSRKLQFLSRIEYAGLSYTGRSNTLAHHYIFPPEEPFPEFASTAAALLAEENFGPWQGKPRFLPQKTELKFGRLPGGNGANCEQLLGSRDWLPIIAGFFRKREGHSVLLEFTPGEHDFRQILGIAAGALDFLNAEESREFTFSTYAYDTQSGNPPFLRACPTGSRALENSRRRHQDLVLTLGADNPITEEMAEYFLLGQEQPRPVVRTITPPQKQPPPVREQPPVWRQPAAPPAERPVNEGIKPAAAPQPPAAKPHRPAANPAAVPKKTRQVPLWLFIAAGVLIIALIIWICVSLTANPPAKPADQKPAPKPADTGRRDAGATAKPAGQEPAPKPADKTPATRPAVKTPATRPAVKTPATQPAVKPADQKPATPAAVSCPAPKIRELTAAEGLSMLLALRSGEKEITLPPALAGAGKLTLTISRIEDYDPKEVPVTAYLTGNGSTEVSIRGVKSKTAGYSTTYEADTEDTLTLKLRDNRLLIGPDCQDNDKRGKQRKNLKNITAITFDTTAVAMEFTPAYRQAAREQLKLRLELNRNGELTATVSGNENWPEELQKFFEVSVKLQKKEVGKFPLWKGEKKQPVSEYKILLKHLPEIASAAQKANEAYEIYEKNKLTDRDFLETEPQLHKMILEKLKPETAEKLLPIRCNDSQAQTKLVKLIKYLNDEQPKLMKTKYPPAKARQRTADKATADTREMTIETKLTEIQINLKQKIEIGKKCEKSYDKAQKDYQDKIAELTPSEYAEAIFGTDYFKTTPDREKMQNKIHTWFEKNLSAEIIIREQNNDSGK